MVYFLKKFANISPILNPWPAPSATLVSHTMIYLVICVSSKAVILEIVVRSNGREVVNLIAYNMQPNLSSIHCIQKHLFKAYDFFCTWSLSSKQLYNNFGGYTHVRMQMDTNCSRKDKLRDVLEAQPTVNTLNFIWNSCV